MSTYFGAAITIGISNDFMWIEPFVDALYATGDVYSYPLGKPVEWGGRVELSQVQALDYFRQYMKQLQNAVTFSDIPPNICWGIGSIGYTVDIYSKPGYIKLYMHLVSNKKYKDIDNVHADYEYYLRFLIKTMQSFPILEVWGGCDDNYGDPEWSQKEGVWWGFKIQDPLPDYSFQMLDVVLFAEFTIDFLIRLISYTKKHNYSFFPLDMLSSSIPDHQKIIDWILFQKGLPTDWICMCDNKTYRVGIVPFHTIPFTRLLFRTEERSDTPHINVLVDHVLNIFSPEILEQVSSFDSRYNCLISK